MKYNEIYTYVCVFTFFNFSFLLGVLFNIRVTFEFFLDNIATRIFKKIESNQF